MLPFFGSNIIASRATFTKSATSTILNHLTSQMQYSMTRITSVSSQILTPLYRYSKLISAWPKTLIFIWFVIARSRATKQSPHKQSRLLRRSSSQWLSVRGFRSDTNYLFPQVFLSFPWLKILLTLCHLALCYIAQVYWGLLGSDLRNMLHINK